MNELSRVIASGAPQTESDWLVSVIAALQELRPAYHCDPRGVVRLNRAIAKFQWDGVNRQFYANLIDGQLSFGSVVDGVITGIDPGVQSIDEAADYIHARFANFLNRLRARDAR